MICRNNSLIRLHTYGTYVPTYVHRYIVSNFISTCDMNARLKRPPNPPLDASATRLLRALFTAPPHQWRRLPDLPPKIRPGECWEYDAPSQPPKGGCEDGHGRIENEESGRGRTSGSAQEEDEEQDNKQAARRSEL